MAFIDDLLAQLGGGGVNFNTVNESPRQLGVQNTPATGTSFFPGSFIGNVPVGPGTNRSRREETRQENARFFGQRQAATLQPILQTLMQALGFGGGGGFGGGFGDLRANLLDPRLADIEQERERGAGQIRETATSQGRNVSASPFQNALATLTGGATKERQRATGDVDLLLAQLGQGQQSLMFQLLSSILGGFGGQLA